MDGKSVLAESKVVAIGGGHGLAVMLKALKGRVGQLSAVVTVADDGGSSGRIRRELGLVPPGDLRMCLSALADPESALLSSFTYRFNGGDLAGHSLGNLMLAALTDLLGGLGPASRHMGMILGASGLVFPSAEEPLGLLAETDQGQLSGQVAINACSGIRRVWVEPQEPKVSTEALEAILEADLLVLGPGSLFTSVLAACVVPAIREAIKSTTAQRVYVANLRQQKAETAYLDQASQVEKVLEVIERIDGLLLDPNHNEVGDLSRVLAADVCVEAGSLSSDGGFTHDSTLLANALARVAEHNN